MAVPLRSEDDGRDTEPPRLPENELLLCDEEFENELELRLLLPECELRLLPENELPLRDEEPEYELLLRDELECELPLNELWLPPPRELLDEEELWPPPREPPPRPWAYAGVTLSRAPSATIAINLLVFIIYPFV